MAMSSAYFRSCRPAGLAGYFVRSGPSFQVLYETPDGHALVPGVLRDAEGKNITRSQVSDIPGAIPTVEVTGNRGPRLATAPTQISAATAATLAAIEKGAYGTIGPAAAPQLFMLIDPQCVYSGGGLLPGLDANLRAHQGGAQAAQGGIRRQRPADRPGWWHRSGRRRPAALSPQRGDGGAPQHLRLAGAIGAARPRCRRGAARSARGAARRARGDVSRDGGFRVDAEPAG